MNAQPFMNALISVHFGGKSPAQAVRPRAGVRYRVLVVPARGEVRTLLRWLLATVGVFGFRKKLRLAMRACDAASGLPLAKWIASRVADGGCVRTVAGATETRCERNWATPIMARLASPRCRSYRNVVRAQLRCSDRNRAWPTGCRSYRSVKEKKRDTRASHREPAHSRAVRMQLPERSSAGRRRCGVGLELGAVRQVAA